MKKAFFLLVFSLGGLIFSSQNASAQNLMVNVQLQVRYFDPSHGLESESRGPMNQLTIGLEDHILYMSNVDFDCELQILDENGNMVYTTFVEASTPIIALPSTLSGNYEILLIDEERYFTGWIDL